jgi:hypothetical protein
VTLKGLNLFTVLIFHDGRNDYLEQTLSTFSEQVVFPSRPHTILVDDMPGGRDEGFLRSIAARFGIDQVILNDENLGSFGTIMKGWSSLPDSTEYVFHLENDFVFPARIQVHELATVLQEPWICNITLLRQPWFEDERAAGGLFRARPQIFRETSVRGVPVCLHQSYFGHNPGLYRREYARVIPDTSRAVPGVVVSHERIYRDVLLAEDPRRHFAVFGRLTDPPRVLHIGVRRVGVTPDQESRALDQEWERDERTELAREEAVLLRRIGAVEREIHTILEPAIEARYRDIDALSRPWAVPDRRHD